jgi:hypothetical protein
MSIIRRICLRSTPCPSLKMDRGDLALFISCLVGHFTVVDKLVARNSFLYRLYYNMFVNSFTINTVFMATGDRLASLPQICPSNFPATSTRSQHILSLDTSLTLSIIIVLPYVPMNIERLERIQLSWGIIVLTYRTSKP